MSIKNTNQLIDTINTVITSNNKSPTKKNLEKLEKLVNKDYSFLDQTGGTIMKETLDILRENYEKDYEIKPYLLKKNHIEEITNHTLYGGGPKMNEVISKIDDKWIVKGINLVNYRDTLRLRKDAIDSIINEIESLKTLAAAASAAEEKQAKGKYIGRVIMLRGRIKDLVADVDKSYRKEPLAADIKKVKARIVTEAIQFAKSKPVDEAAAPSVTTHGASEVSTSATAPAAAAPSVTTHGASEVSTSATAHPPPLRQPMSPPLPPQPLPIPLPLRKSSTPQPDQIASAAAESSPSSPLEISKWPQTPNAWVKFKGFTGFDNSGPIPESASEVIDDYGQNWNGIDRLSPKSMKEWYNNPRKISESWLAKEGTHEGQAWLKTPKGIKWQKSKAGL